MTSKALTNSARVVTDPIELNNPMRVKWRREMYVNWKYADIYLPNLYVFLVLFLSGVKLCLNWIITVWLLITSLVLLTASKLKFWQSCPSVHFSMNSDVTKRFGIPDTHLKLRESLLNFLILLFRNSWIIKIFSNIAFCLSEFKNNVHEHWLLSIRITAYYFQPISNV